MARKDYFSPFLQEFFIEYLPVERRLSKNTVASYRDTFKLLFKYISKNRRKCPSQLKIKDVFATDIVAFLNHLEKDRGVSAQTRNQRLAAIKTFYKFLTLRKIDLSLQIQQVLTLQPKRHSKRYVDYLSIDEANALVGVLQTDNRKTLRDYLIIKTMLDAGLRVAEVSALKKKDVVSESGYLYLKVHGKGRKNRSVPIDEPLFQKFSQYSEPLGTDSLLFVNSNNMKLTNNGISYVLKKYVNLASRNSKSLATKTVTCHVLRHTSAMRLLEAGVGIATIALWLGHEKIETTQIYLNSNMDLKQKILQDTVFSENAKGAELFKADDELMTFLDKLA